MSQSLEEIIVDLIAPYFDLFTIDELAKALRTVAVDLEENEHGIATGDVG